MDNITHDEMVERLAQLQQAHEITLKLLTEGADTHSGVFWATLAECEAVIRKFVLECNPGYLGDKVVAEAFVKNVVAMGLLPH